MTTGTATHIPAGTWALDPVHSAATFRVRHFGIAWLRGRFDQLDLQLSSADDGTLALRGSAPVESVSFTNEQLKGHLMSPDFFDAQLHPSVEFASSGIDLHEDGTAIVHGELTLKGTTRHVELRGTWAGPIEDLYGNQRMALELAGEIDRHDFGVSWQAQLPGGIDVVASTVRIEGEFELVQQ